MKLCKYIIVEKNGFESAILVHPGVSHNEAVNPEQLQAADGLVRSAGFFAMTESGVFVDAGLPSTSLNLRPRHQDAGLIERTLFLMGLPTAIPQRP